MSLTINHVHTGKITHVHEFDPAALQAVTDLTASIKALTAVLADEASPETLAALQVLKIKADSIDPHPGASHVPTQ